LSRTGTDGRDGDAAVAPGQGVGEGDGLAEMTVWNFDTDGAELQTPMPRADAGNLDKRNGA
jgi:hypothetical protein